MKIMYLTHVNWFWIFQRPQILALFLERDFEVTVYSKQVLFKPRLSKNNKRPMRLKRIIQLPKENHIIVFKHINKWIVDRTMNKMHLYDAVWICHPTQYVNIPEDYHGLVIYDCMDNHGALVSEENKPIIRTLEDKLIERADVIFASSNYLQDQVLAGKASFLVRNGYNYIESFPPVATNKKKTYNIGYFGTISAWFDFDLLRSSLELFENVQYRLIGPNDTSFSGEEKITLEGVVQHSELGNAIKDYDALIMPFVVNDIILAVDPVKLYEYISFGKCVISVWYPEIDRFDPYVYFYRDSYEYAELLTELVRNGFKPKYNETQQIEFLQENTWEARYKTIRRILKDMESGKESKGKFGESMK
ncbi:hypothetical protein [Mordavella massiliensis]|uniref:hypothetical protein n=1 Tax=Mordavella massiliensis TaxID=1871024 RepID=UPI00210DE1B3|nr:hypothetical protein [Mordavella massiliensis]